MGLTNFVHGGGADTAVNLNILQRRSGVTAGVRVWRVDGGVGLTRNDWVARLKHREFQLQVYWHFWSEQNHQMQS